LDSEFSSSAERIRKEAQDYICMMSSQCVPLVCLAHARECNAAASGRAEVVAKKFNIKMTKVLLPLALAECVCGVPICS